MNHEEWTARRTATTVRADGHDLEVAYHEDACRWVVEDRAGEELRTFRSETHTTAGDE